MATITELFQQGHRRMRLSVWAPGNYLEVPQLPGTEADPQHGPWAFLYFPAAGAEDMGCPQHSGIWEFKQEGWEPYEGPEIEPREPGPLPPDFDYTKEMAKHQPTPPDKLDGGTP